MTKITDELWLRSPSGVLAVPGARVSQVEWALAENTFGVLRATGPLGGALDLDPRLLALDARFEVHRFINGRPLGVEGDTQFLLRYWSVGRDEGGLLTWAAEAYTPEYALTGRMIDSYASTVAVTNPLTTKTGAADDLIKDWLDENMTVGATGYRRCFEIAQEANVSRAPSVTKSAARAPLFDVFNSLAASSLEAGTWLSWGLVASGAGAGFTFRTWVDHRGADRRSGTPGGVIVSEEMGNLRAGRVSFDHRQEVNAVVALGRGEGAERMSVRVEDTTRVYQTPWAARELAIESQAETTAGLTQVANAALAAGRPVRGFTGKLIDTDYARYGLGVRYGDLVTALCQGCTFDCRLARVQGRWGAGSPETLDIDLVGSVYV